VNVATKIRPERRRVLRRSSGGAPHTDNRLAFIDQATYQMMRTTGRAQLMQIVWIYEHPVDFDELRRFHRDLGYGLAGRRVERSPLPFGRHRWVECEGPAAEIDFAEEARPRSEVTAWADERAQLIVDPEWGPGWHMGVLPLTDGSTAVSLVGSHCLLDGVGALLTIVDAVKGNARHLGYPAAKSRTRLRAIASDARSTVQGLPETGRTLVAAAKLAYRSRNELARPETAPKSLTVAPSDGEDNVIMPAIAIYVDLEQWDARAQSLNGNSYSMLAGFTAKFAEQMGRLRAEDGAATLIIALNDRTSFDDTRANAMAFANVSLDPTAVTEDLTGSRVAIRQALKAARETPDETLQLLPLVPLVPKRALKHVVELFFGQTDDLPVSCSNLGDIDPALARADGTDAEYVLLRGVDQHVSRQHIERIGGQLVVASGRINGKITIGIVAYQPGGDNSRTYLREVAAKTLAAFELSGVID
jgi:hypothetical protein